MMITFCICRNYTSSISVKLFGSTIQRNNINVVTVLKSDSLIYIRYCCTYKKVVLKMETTPIVSTLSNIKELNAAAY